MNKIFLYILILFGLLSYSKNNEILVRVIDENKDQSGYKNLKGEMVIPFGKYVICFTDTIKNYGVVLKSGGGFIAIDNQDNELYKIFPFDNGPDYTSEGLFSIVQNNKIGYADSLSGKIVIKPQYQCAYPFSNGRAQVSVNCESKTDGEYTTWQSNKWFYINKNGKKQQ